jgi:hypothetical protein
MKGGIASFINPVHGLSIDLSSDNHGAFTYKALRGGAKLIPGSETVQFTKYKKKAKMTVVGIDRNSMGCAWTCKPARHNGSYVSGYGIAKAIPPA